MKPLKAKKLPLCKQCKQPFTKFQSSQIVCGYQCAKEYAEQKRVKEDAKKARIERKTHREAIVKAKPLSWHEDRAQRSINAWIVHVRDKDEPCISCGTRNPNIIYAAGHFRTRGAASQLRYNPDNLHKQCNFHCNSQLSGNIQNYRPALIAKIGMERYEALMNNNEPHRYSIEELDGITRFYRNLMRTKG